MDIKLLYTNFKTWLNQHPFIKGGLILAESTALTTLINIYQTGGIQLTKQGIHNLVVAVAGSVYIALQNYFRTRATSLKTIKK